MAVYITETSVIATNRTCLLCNIYKFNRLILSKFTKLKNSIDILLLMLYSMITTKKTLTILLEADVL